MATKPKSESEPKADRFRLSSVLSGAVRSLVSLVTTYGQTSFNGRQFSTKVYTTPTDCVKGLGSPTTKDLEFAALIDRTYAPPLPLTVDIGIDGTATVKHLLGAAPRAVTLLGWSFEFADPNSYQAILITGWDAEHISVAGSPGAKVWIGLNR
jgi:hypothetical protein